MYVYSSGRVLECMCTRVVEYLSVCVDDCVVFHSRPVPKHQGDFPQEVEFGEVGGAGYLRPSGVEGAGSTAPEEVGL